MRAAEAGNAIAQCGAGNMLMKGEGTVDNIPDIPKALNYFELAAKQGSTRALNGLGYIYFRGENVAVNHTRAFENFMAAAMLELDGDSLYNFGHCIQYGIGTEKDELRAAELFAKSAKKFGHFDSVLRLGIMYMEGIGVERNADLSLQYLSVAASIGPWNGWLRRGLDQYLESMKSKNSELRSLLLTRSLFAYLHAGELGYEVALGNAAFLLQRRANYMSRELSLNEFHSLSSASQHYNEEEVKKLEMKVAGLEPIKIQQLPLRSRLEKRELELSIQQVLFCFCDSS